MVQKQAGQQHTHTRFQLCALSEHMITHTRTRFNSKKGVDCGPETSGITTHAHTFSNLCALFEHRQTSTKRRTPHDTTGENAAQCTHAHARTHTYIHTWFTTMLRTATPWVFNAASRRFDSAMASCVGMVTMQNSVASWFLKRSLSSI